MQATIRLATDSDVAIMQAIELDAGELFRGVGLGAIADNPPPTKDVLKSHISERTAWVAELDRQVVGYAISSIVDEEGHLDQVSLARSASRQGIGARLIREVCDWSRNLGYRSVTLTTFRDVPWNAPYYAQLGFSVIAGEDCGPELLAIRTSETTAGIDISPRVAMRLTLPS
jgi:GNAT superfamily N-acetyltransferase